VGRDATLDPSEVCTSAWAPLSMDSSVVRLITAWNEVSLKRFSQSISDIGKEMVAAFESTGTDGKADGKAEVFGKVEALSENASKKVMMINSIAKFRGQQLPLADPLVVASLLDTVGTLAPFERKCKAGHDQKGKPTFNPEPHSSVATLFAKSDDQPKLYAAALAVLASALSPAGNAKPPRE